MLTWKELLAIRLVPLYLVRPSPTGAEGDLQIPELGKKRPFEDVSPDAQEPSTILNARRRKKQEGARNQASGVLVVEEENDTETKGNEPGTNSMEQESDDDSNESVHTVPDSEKFLNDKAAVIDIIRNVRSNQRDTIETLRALYGQARTKIQQLIEEYSGSLDTRESIRNLESQIAQLESSFAREQQGVLSEPERTERKSKLIEALNNAYFEEIVDEGEQERFENLVDNGLQTEKNTADIQNRLLRLFGKEVLNKARRRSSIEKGKLNNMDVDGATVNMNASTTHPELLRKKNELQIQRNEQDMKLQTLRERIKALVDRRKKMQEAREEELSRIGEGTTFEELSAWIGEVLEKDQLDFADLSNLTSTFNVLVKEDDGYSRIMNRLAKLEKKEQEQLAIETMVADGTAKSNAPVQQGPESGPGEEKQPENTDNTTAPTPGPVPVKKESVDKPGDKLGDKPGDKPESTPGPVPVKKESVDKPGDKLGDKPGDKPESTPGPVPVKKESVDKPGDKLGDKPGDKPESTPGPVPVKKEPQTTTSSTEPTTGSQTLSNELKEKQKEQYALFVKELKIREEELVEALLAFDEAENKDKTAIIDYFRGINSITQLRNNVNPEDQVVLNLQALEKKKTKLASFIQYFLKQLGAQESNLLTTLQVEGAIVDEQIARLSNAVNVQGGDQVGEKIKDVGNDTAQNADSTSMDVEVEQGPRFQDATRTGVDDKGQPATNPNLNTLENVQNGSVNPTRPPAPTPLEVPPPQKGQSTNSRASGEFDVIEIPGDGNCLYTAIARGMVKNPRGMTNDKAIENGKRIRSTTMERIYKENGDGENVAPYKDLILKDPKLKEQNIGPKQYVEQNSQCGSWGSDIEGVIIAAEYNLSINIYQMDQAQGPNKLNLRQTYNPSTISSFYQITPVKNAKAYSRLAKTVNLRYDNENHFTLLVKKGNNTRGDNKDAGDNANENDDGDIQMVDADDLLAGLDVPDEFRKQLKEYMLAVGLLSQEGRVRKYAVDKIKDQVAQVTEKLDTIRTVFRRYNSRSASKEEKQLRLKAFESIPRELKRIDAMIKGLGVGQKKYAVYIQNLDKIIGDLDKYIEKSLNEEDLSGDKVMTEAPRFPSRPGGVRGRLDGRRLGGAPPSSGFDANANADSLPKLPTSFPRKGRFIFAPRTINDDDKVVHMTMKQYNKLLNSLEKIQKDQWMFKSRMKEVLRKTRQRLLRKPGEDLEEEIEELERSKLYGQRHNDLLRTTEETLTRYKALIEKAKDLSDEMKMEDKLIKNGVFVPLDVLDEQDQRNQMKRERRSTVGSLASQVRQLELPSDSVGSSDDGSSDDGRPLETFKMLPMSNFDPAKIASLLIIGY